MNKFFKNFIAVTLVTATLLSCLFVPASAAFSMEVTATAPSPFIKADKYNYPDISTLPYGSDSKIVETNKVFYDDGVFGYYPYVTKRFCMSSDSVYFINGWRSSSEAISYISIFMFSNDEIYESEYSYGNNCYRNLFHPVESDRYNSGISNSTYFISSEFYKYTLVYSMKWDPQQAYEDLFVNSNFYPLTGYLLNGPSAITSKQFTSSNGLYISYYFLYKDYPISVSPEYSHNWLKSSGMLETDNTEFTGYWRYDNPFFHSLKYEDLSSSILSGEIVSEVNANNDKNATEIINAIGEAVTSIISAGDDLPTLDTVNDWMNDALTKVNGWLDSLDDFNDQMDDNLSENEENLENASSFINGFFDIVPAGIVAALALVLVMIVVVKVVGR